MTALAIQEDRQRYLARRHGRLSVHAPVSERAAGGADIPSRAGRHPRPGRAEVGE